MALQPTALTVRFQGTSIDTKADPKVVPLGRLLKAENTIYTRLGSAAKRTGYTSLGTTVLGAATGYTDTRGLGARGDELILFAEGTSYSYVEQASAWSEIPDGVQSVRQTDRAIVKTISNQTGCDVASVGNLSMVGWDDSRGGVWFAVVETDGGRVVIAPTEASDTGQTPRCVRSGDTLILVWAEAALGHLRCLTVDSAAPHAYVGVLTLVDDLVTTMPTFDAHYVDDRTSTGADAACVTWNATSGIRVAWLTPAGTIGTVGQGYPSPLTEVAGGAVTAGPTIKPLAIGSSSQTWMVAWAIAGQSYLMIVDSSLAFPATPIAVYVGPGELGIADVDRIAVANRLTDGVQMVDVWLEDRAATVRNSFITRASTPVVGGAITTSVTRGCVLASKAWTDEVSDELDSPSYVNVLHSTPLQATYLALRYDGLVVAQTVPGNAGDPPGRILPTVIDDGRSFSWCAVYRGKLDALNSDVFTEQGPRLVTLDFDAADAYQTAYVGRTLYLGGACTMAYDGVSWVEAGFCYAPDWEVGATLHTFSAAGTGGMANGTYSYIAWYEATLANGEIIRGPTSKPYPVTVAGADNRVTLAIPTMRHGAWGRSTRENCRVCVARSLDGDTSVYYRITSLDPSATGANGYVANSQTVDTVNVIDEYSDATLATKEPHYTTGGVPSNDAIATSGVIAEGGGRLFLGSSSDADAVYFSHGRAEGFTCEVTPELRLALPPYGGDLTGIATMDAQQLLFKRGAVYRVDGEGPVPGQSAVEGWTRPQLVTTDVGCLDQRTIATTPIGVLFQSAKGVYQLDRGGQASYVGAPVEAYNGQRITRATLVDNTTQIRFLTDDGYTLHYDYGSLQFGMPGQWSTFTQHEGVDSVIVAGTYYYLRTDGRVFKQSTGYLDANLQIPHVIETAWIRFGEARQGFQRLWHLQILGTWKSAHTLRVQVMTDYDGVDNWSEPVEFDASSMGGDDYGDGNYGDGNYGGDSPSPYEFLMHVGLKCESARFRFTFIEDPDDAGACAELTELLITGGAKGLRNRLPDERMG
jgi:hypothetical protein